jgi:hypothetical protein
MEHTRTMPMDVPKPADDEFEAQLSWSPPEVTATPAVRPASPAPARVTAHVPARQPDRDGSDELLEVHRSILRLEEELIAVRQAVPQRPQLDLLVQDLRQLRGEVASVVGQVREELVALRASVADHIGPSAADLEALKEEMVQLRRRIGLRANGADPDAEDAMVERVADATVARLTARQDDGVMPRSRRSRSR